MLYQLSYSGGVVVENNTESSTTVAGCCPMRVQRWVPPHRTHHVYPSQTVTVEAVRTGRGIRTPNLRFWRPLRYQLRHARKQHRLVPTMKERVTGFEPVSPAWKAEVLGHWTTLA